MTEQTKNPGAMVLVPRIATEEMIRFAEKCVPKTPNAQWSAMIAAAPAVQQPAVGGEPEVLAWVIQYGSSLLGITGHRSVQLEDPTPCSGQVTELIDRTHVAPLLAEIEQNKYKADLYDEVWGLATGLGYLNVTTAISELRKEVDKTKAELEAAAQQGEPIELADDVREYLQEGVENATGGEDADIDHEFAEELCLLLRPLYRHAQPATAKLVLPERKPDITGTDSSEEGWNACLDEVAKLNGLPA